ncbi:MAG: superoxide dismutase [Terriglobia bacterium]
MADGQVKPLKYVSLPGLSEKQLSEHHDVLYAGYVAKVLEIEKAIEGADKGGANATYSPIRELKHELAFASDGVKLHEAYFDNMGGDGRVSGEIAGMIEKEFKSFDAWSDDFRATGMSARGWAVLAYDLDNHRLHNYSCDLHNQGGVWNSIALLVMDVYEHAYFIDYATARKAYIDAFFAVVDWDEVNRRLTQYGLK